MSFLVSHLTEKTLTNDGHLFAQNIMMNKTGVTWVSLGWVYDPMTHKQSGFHCSLLISTSKVFK